MRHAKELIRIWTEALVPVCNNSKDHASQEVKWLLQHAKEQAKLLANSQGSNSQSPGQNGRMGNLDPVEDRVSRGSSELTSRVTELMQSYVDQRVDTRKPLQYILGTQPFMDLEIITRPPTLIPRWETEEWTARLAAVLKRTGCIPLGLASELPQGSCNIIGVDIHPNAVQLARENEISNYQLLNANKVSFQQADLLDPNAVKLFQSWVAEPTPQDTLGKPLVKLESQNNNSWGYDLIISNPPYIAHSEYDELEPEVSQWEDPKALLADQDGLVFYPKIASMAMELLRKSSRDSNQSNCNGVAGSERQWRNGPDLDKVLIPELVFEIGGDHQVDFITRAVRQVGFSRVEVWKDLADRSRCIIGSR
ncbi:hypothetical protein BGZ76_004281 [Entomortierella beljakovae]|nr:hypothetical protein BGZ76_004281 [Entomortierella beljakovae]